MEPSDFETSAKEVMETCNRLCAALEAPAKPRTRVEAVDILYRLDEISRVVCNVIDAAELCRSTHASEEWRRAANDAFTTLSDYIGQLNANVHLYRALVSVTADTALLQQLTAEEQRFAHLLQTEFERDGIHLPDDTREQVRQLQNEIVQLEGTFQRNLVHWQRPFEAPRRDVQGVIPAHVLAQFGVEVESSETVQLPSNGQILQTLIKYSTSPSLRQQAYMEYNTAVPENLQVLQELRLQRHALATTLGFASFAERVLADNKMAPSTQTVHAFLTKMAQQNESAYRKEMTMVSKAKQHLEGTEELQPWDMSFYTSMIKAQRGSYDAHKISRYLTLEGCITAIQTLCRDLFGISMSEKPIPAADRWDGGQDGDERRVRCFVFSEQSTNLPLGTMYLDLHPRPGKFGHAAHFTVRCGCVTNGPESVANATTIEPIHQLPIVALVCNLTSASGKTLSHGEVETLFHEMGHALHSLLSRTNFQHVSGTRGAMDFVETPSHLMENFVWDRQFLKLLAVHPKTGEVIPDELVDKLVQSRHQLAAIDRQQQIVYSMFDQKLFEAPPAGTEEKFFSLDSSTVLFSNLHHEFQVPFASDTHWHSRFGHLVTYAAGYYGYLFAQEFSKRIWEQKLKGNPLNQQAGQDIWRKVLIHGGAKDPHLMLRDLLG